VIDWGLVDGYGTPLGDAESWAKWRELVRDMGALYDKHPDLRDPFGDTALVNFGGFAGGGKPGPHAYVLGVKR